MTEGERRFRDALVAQEPVTPSLKQKHERELQAMMEKKVDGVRRWGWLVSGVWGGGVALLFAGLAIGLPAEFPAWSRAGFALGALAGLVWMALGIKVFRRGAIDLKVDTLIASGMAWGLPLALAVIYMMAAPEDLNGLRMIVSAQVYLLIGAVFLVQYLIERSERNTREKLLEIEYHLAELAEAAQAKQGGA
jgi:hypothetical protein